MASREHEIHDDADYDATRTLLIIGNGFDLYHNLAGICVMTGCLLVYLGACVLGRRMVQFEV